MKNIQNLSSFEKLRRYSVFPWKRFSERKFLSGLFTIALQLGLSSASLALTFNVTSNADAGANTLRQAILNINASADPGPHIINFSGMTNTAAGRTITLSSNLPVLTKPTTIDGSTAPSYVAGTPSLYIRGFNYVFLFNNTGANGSILRGIVMDRCTSYGIELNGVSNITIEGCWIGLLTSGAAPGMPNTNRINNHGIFVTACTNITIGGTTAAARNVISAILASGISIEGASSNVSVIGNYIGIDPTAAASRANSSHGINIVTASNITIGGITTNHRNIIAGNTATGINLDNVTTANIMGNYIGIRNATTAEANGVNGINVLNNSSGIVIGGTTTNHRNIISGNLGTGVNVASNSHGTVVKGNYIGTNEAGTAALGNGTHGLYIEFSNNCIIGGPSKGERNVISGNGTANGENGIGIINSTGHIIQGNFLGLNANGNGAIQNFDTGLSMTTVSGVTVGGATYMSRNVSSGNRNFGVFLSNVDNSTFQGNYFGTDSTGNAALANLNYGVLSQDGSDNITWQSNVISGNTFTGINLFTATGNIFYGNYVGLGSNGVTAVPNGGLGMRFGGSANGNTIGGTGAGQRNYASGNGDHAIFFDGASSSNIVRGNYVGSDVTGLIAVPNGGAGIFMLDEANNNLIGGAGAGEGNLICCNVLNGIRIQISSGNVIYGNIIGLNSAGVAATGFGNGGEGILVGSYWNLGSQANANIIGGLGAGQANIITKSGTDGVRIAVWGGSNGSNYNPIIGNKIYCNGAMGINHENNLANENEGVPAPVITSRLANSVGGTGVNGYTVHVYRNDTGDGGVACDCEGETYIGFAIVAGGTWTLPHGLGLTTAQADAVTATQTNGTNSTSEFSLCVNPPLPVEYLYFTATAINENSALIEWGTASEKNNKEFIVQRSSDGVHYSDIKTITGNGTTYHAQHYSFTDESVSDAVVYYRIKQIDLDGKIHYSPVKQVQFTKDQLSFIVSEDNAGTVQAYLLEAGLLNIHLYTASGQLVYKNQLQASSGLTEDRIDLTGQAPGLYLATISTANHSVTTKFIIK